MCRSSFIDKIRSMATCTNDCTARITKTEFKKFDKEKGAKREAEEAKYSPGPQGFGELINCRGSIVFHKARAAVMFQNQYPHPLF